MHNDFMPSKVRLGNSRFRKSPHPHKNRSRSDIQPNQGESPIESQSPNGPELAGDPAAAPENPTPNGKNSWRDKLPKLTKFKNLSKKHRLVSLAACGALLIVGTVAGLELFIKDPPPPEPVNITAKVRPPEPKTVASRLTGVQVTPEQNALPTTAVMIENSPDARPQSGLYDAGLVFEAIAEGGITRFLSIYHYSMPGSIGPVRSVRPYYLDLFVPFDAPIAHAGGSAQALSQIRNEGIKDLDQFANPGAYRRVSSRFAPHNLYTSRKQLLDLQRSKGFDKSDFSGFVRKAEEKDSDKKPRRQPDSDEDKTAKLPAATKVELDISSFLYNPRFDYDSKSNSYKRFLAGKPHVDADNGKQINPKVVVVLVMSYSKNGIYSVYKTTGSGKAFIFQDGSVNEGIWEKKSRSSQFKFGDKNGAPLGLNPGKTWVTLVDGASKVSVTP